MNYERQESAIDFTGNRESEAETADYIALHGEEFVAETTLAESMAQMIEADNAKEKVYHTYTSTVDGVRTAKIVIDHRWLEAERHITDDVFEPRYRMPRICGLDVEHAAADAFKNFYVKDGVFPRIPRIQINKITLSKGWEPK